MNRIKELRLAHGIKQTDIAERFNVTQSTVSGWESGRREPDFDTLSTLAKMFGCSIEELYGHDKTPTVEQNGERSVLDITDLSPENRDKLEEYMRLLLMSQDK